MYLLRTPFVSNQTYESQICGKWCFFSFRLFSQWLLSCLNLVQTRKAYSGGANKRGEFFEPWQLHKQPRYNNRKEAVYSEENWRSKKVQNLDIPERWIRKVRYQYECQKVASHQERYKDKTATCKNITITHFEFSLVVVGSWCPIHPIIFLEPFAWKQMPPWHITHLKTKLLPLENETAWSPFARYYS